MAKRWQKSEVAYLERHAGSKSPQELAKHFKTDVKTLKAKLAELAAKSAGGAPDPMLEAYGGALRAMYKKDWPRSAKLFESLLHDGDRPELADRARQFLVAIRQRQAAEGSEEGAADPYLTAVVHKNRGELQVALEICRRGGREKKDERFAYLAASIHALEDRPEEAAKSLAHAVELNPKNRIHAYHDPDFAELRRARDYRHLFELP